MGTVAILIPFAASALADDLRIAENIVLYQRETGGWPKNYDRKQELTDAQRLDGRLVMPVRQPNQGKIRARLFELEDVGNTLRIKGEIPMAAKPK